jgi:hypothetical protein
VRDDLNAPNKRIVTVDVKIHQRQIGLILFQRQRRFVASTGGLFCNYEDAVSVVKQYDYSG